MTTFRNDHQRALACKTLLSFLGLEVYFTTEGAHPGPTQLAGELLTCIKRDGPSMLSRGEQVMICVAFDFWNGAGTASIWQILSHMNVNVVHAIGELLIACTENPEMSGAPVDEWVKKWRGYRVVHAPNGFTVG